MLEVMCSADSGIAKQANHLGARAARFGLAQGDLQEIGHRRKLFQLYWYIIDLRMFGLVLSVHRGVLGVDSIVPNLRS